MNVTAPDTQASILVVDDTPSQLRLLRYVLSEQGYRIRAAVDGRRALESARADPPNLILLDILLPGMSGCVGVDSVAGEGSTFHFTLPAEG